MFMDIMKLFTNCGMLVGVIHTHIHMQKHAHTINDRIYEGFILFCYYLNCF